MEIKCPHCQHHIDLVLPADSSVSSCPVCGSKIDFLGETQSARSVIMEVTSGFELLEVVGCGHFGEVWKARDAKLDRLVALKFPRRGSVDRATLSSVIREAQASASLRHPNIVAIHDVVNDDRRVFIVSEFIQGLSLSEYLKIHQVDARQAATLCATVADALQHAHEHGVIHRDLKPGNILVDGEGKPYLTDFGLAKREGDVITITMDGQILGTPAYMSPEQAAGHGHDADARSDIYSLGVILYELLAGKRPFQGGSKMLLHQVLYSEPPALRSQNDNAPRDLETICFKAMEKNPKRRYATAAEMAADLRRFLNGEPITARPVSRAERTYRWCVRNPGWSAAIAASFLAIAGTGIITSLRRAEGAAFVRRNAELSSAIVELTTTNEQTRLEKEQLDRLLKRQTVTIGSEPAGAEMVFYPINPGTGMSDFEQRTVFASATQPTVDLRPGIYFVVAHLTNGDFNEVFRYVPGADPRAEIPFLHAHRFFSNRQEGQIQLKAIKIPTSDTATGGMAHIPGTNRFETREGSIKSSFSVPDFFIDCTEVTVAQFRKTGVGAPIGYKAKYPDDFPATNVRVDDAIGFAERLGKRLPAGVLFEYVATNLGTTKFPWGDDESHSPAWELSAVGSVAFDRLLSEPSVLGLLSNAREWTCSAPPNFAIHRSDNFSLSSDSMATAHGGPKTVDSTPMAWKGIDARTRFALPVTSGNEQISFRCVRSVRPSLARSDFLRLVDESEKSN